MKSLYWMTLLTFSIIMHRWVSIVTNIGRLVHIQSAVIWKRKARYLSSIVKVEYILLFKIAVPNNIRTTALPENDVNKGIAFFRRVRSRWGNAFFIDWETFRRTSIYSDERKNQHPASVFIVCSDRFLVNSDKRFWIGSFGEVEKTLINPP